MRSLRWSALASFVAEHPKTTGCRPTHFIRGFLFYDPCIPGFLDKYRLGWVVDIFPWLVGMRVVVCHGCKSFAPDINIVFVRWIFQLRWFLKFKNTGVDSAKEAILLSDVDVEDFEEDDLDGYEITMEEKNEN